MQLVKELAHSGRIFSEDCSHWQRHAHIIVHQLAVITLLVLISRILKLRVRRVRLKELRFHIQLDLIVFHLTTVIVLILLLVIEDRRFIRCRFEVLGDLIWLVQFSLFFLLAETHILLQICPIIFRR